MNRMQHIHCYAAPLIALALVGAAGCVAGDIDTEEAFDDDFGEEVGVAGDELGAQSVTLYQHIGYGGSAVTLTGDNADLRNIGFNDVASSLVLNNGAVLTAYEHIFYAGRCKTFRTSDADLRNNWVGNDQFSSIRIGDFCTVSPYRVNVSNQAALVIRFQHRVGSTVYGWNQLTAGQSRFFDFTNTAGHVLEVQMLTDLFQWQTICSYGDFQEQNLNVTVSGTLFNPSCAAN